MRLFREGKRVAHIAKDPLTVARDVFEILWEKLDPGEFAKLMDHLPAPLRP